MFVTIRYSHTQRLHNQLSAAGIIILSPTTNDMIMLATKHVQRHLPNKLPGHRVQGLTDVSLFEQHRGLSALPP